MKSFHSPLLFREQLCVMLKGDKKRGDRCSQRCAEGDKEGTVC